jgi:hypothetical protein
MDERGISYRTWANLKSKHSRFGKQLGLFALNRSPQNNHSMTVSAAM